LRIGLFSLIVKNGAHRTAYTGHFQAMGKPVVHKYAAGQGKYLCFILQPPEGGGKDQPVIIPLEIRPGLIRIYYGFAVMLFSKPFIR
jgi:hypothetical protein